MPDLGGRGRSARAPVAAVAVSGREGSSRSAHRDEPAPPAERPFPRRLAPRWRGPIGALALLCAGFSSFVTHAQDTPIEVRVLSEGAKFIGDGTGGARVTLIDAERGTVLATGITRGGTGDTQRIMHASGRSPPLTTADTASFRAVLDLDAPRRVRAEVEGPLGLPHVQARVSAERWILPGHGTGPGNGWVLELPGLAVSVLQPAREARLPRAVATGEGIEVVAQVMMLCGCPLTPGGLWDANHHRVEVIAQPRGGGAAVGTPLVYAGEPNHFKARLRLAEPGHFTLTVTAFDTRTGATGLARGEVHVTEGDGDPP